MKSLFISKKGYTLIELLVVIGILAVLAAIAIPSVAGLIQKSQATVDNKNAREMTNALERFASEYELYKEDLSMNHVDLSRMDAMQGRVYSVVKTTNRSDFSKFEIGETDENLAYDNFYINKKTNYPLTEIGARRVLTSYLKTKVANFTPLRSGYSFYYSPECGQVVCAKTGSTYEEIEAVAAVSGPYVSMSSSLVTRTSWSFEPNQIGVNQWINLTVNDGKDMMNFNFANVATETLTDYTYLRGFPQYNDTLEKELFYNGRDYHFAIDENTNDKYLNVLVFVFDKEYNGTVYDHKLEIFDSQNPVDLEVVKDYCRIWAGNWDEYSSGEKAVQMDPNNVEREIGYIFDSKPNPEHALAHDFLETGRYCTLYKTPVEVNKASFKYEVKSEDTIVLFDFKQASSNTSDAHTFDEIVYRYYKAITNDGINTTNYLYSQGYCDGNSGYFVGWGPGAYGYIREKTSAPPMYFETSIPDNRIFDMRWELPDDDEDNGDNTPSDSLYDDIAAGKYPSIKSYERKEFAGVVTYIFKSSADYTKMSSPQFKIYDEYQNYSEITRFSQLQYMYVASDVSDKQASLNSEISAYINANAYKYGPACIYLCTNESLTEEQLVLVHNLLHYDTVNSKGETVIWSSGEYSMDVAFEPELFNIYTTPPTGISQEYGNFLNDIFASGSRGYLKYSANGTIEGIHLDVATQTYVFFEYGDFNHEQQFAILKAIKNELPTSSNDEKIIEVSIKDGIVMIDYSQKTITEDEIQNIADVVSHLNYTEKLCVRYYDSARNDPYDDTEDGWVGVFLYEKMEIVPDNEISDELGDLFN